MNLREELLQSIVNYPDFPVAGVGFKDLLPVLRSPKLFARLIRGLCEHAENCGAEQLVAIESRGFLFAVPLALELGIPVTLARKKGKLPGKVIEEPYTCEYGVGGLEIQANAIVQGQKNMIVDDVIATGGTAQAVARILKKGDAVVAGFSFVIEISALQGRSLLLKEFPQSTIHSVVLY